MLKVGIIGTGVIFDLNILGYLENDDVEIKCLCNRTLEKAEQKKEKFKLKKEVRLYTDYKEMLDNEQLDIVEILLPHYLHAEVVILAAKKGIKGISVQKPMALSLDEADEMITACKENGSLLSIYENFLFAPHIIKAKELIDLGHIGDLLSIRIKVAMGATGGWNIPESAKKWRNDPKKMGGHRDKGSPVLLDNGWHAFTLGHWLFGEEIEHVLAKTDDYKNLDAPAYVMWKCKRKEPKDFPQYGTIEFCLMPEMVIPSNYYSTDEFIEISGTKGMMWINQCTSLGNKMSESELFAPIVIFKDGEVEKIEFLEKDWKYSFINATKHFINVLIKGGKTILSGKDAKNILKFNLAAIKSAEINCEVYLDEF